DLLGACAMSFARNYLGRNAIALAAVFATFVGLAGQCALGQEKQAPVTQPAAPAKAAETPARDGRSEKFNRAKPAAEAASNKAAAKLPPASADGKLTFSFRYQPWQDVLDWFAQQAGLSLLMESPPPGTFNYTDTRTYTPAEALDVLNGVLLTKGYTLVRHGRMLVVVNLE